MTEWHWSQWVYATLLALSVILNTSQHGKPRTGTYSGPIAVVGVAVTVFILYCGGFWG